MTRASPLVNQSLSDMRYGFWGEEESLTRWLPRYTLISITTLMGGGVQRDQYGKETRTDGVEERETRPS